MSEWKEEIDIDIPCKHAQSDSNAIVRHVVCTSRKIRIFFEPCSGYRINTTCIHAHPIMGATMQQTLDIQMTALRTFANLYGTRNMSDKHYYGSFLGVIAVLVSFNMKRIAEITEVINEKRYTKLWYAWHLIIRVVSKKNHSLFGQNFISMFDPDQASAIMGNQSLMKTFGINRTNMHAYMKLVMVGIYPPRLDIKKHMRYVTEQCTDVNELHIASTWHYWEDAGKRIMRLSDLPPGIVDTIFDVFTFYRLPVEMCWLILNYIIEYIPEMVKVRMDQANRFTHTTKCVDQLKLMSDADKGYAIKLCDQISRKKLKRITHGYRRKSRCIQAR